MIFYIQILTTYSYLPKIMTQTASMKSNKNDFKKYLMTMALIATVRGTHSYYGSEIGMSGDKDSSDTYSPRFSRWLGN
jgi:glycosidase